MMTIDVYLRILHGTAALNELYCNRYRRFHSSSFRRKSKKTGKIKVSRGKKTSLETKQVCDRHVTSQEALQKDNENEETSSQRQPKNHL